MNSKLSTRNKFLICIIFIFGLACACPGTTIFTPNNPPPAVQPTQNVNPIPNPNTSLVTGTPIPTATQVVVHKMTPSNSPKTSTLIYDVDSKDTGPDKRAPYGDSYDIYRMERPFIQDMIYVPDLDIVTFNVTMEEDWVYVSIKLVGTNPNNDLGIHFGVELDVNGDGFGEYIIWAKPPYTPEWSTNGIQVFADNNHDSGGLSAEKSDAPLDGDGYETMVFEAGQGDDPDLAWVRINAGANATVQFAFKKSLAGSSFLLGVLADSNLKDVTKMYYNDRFTEEEAGSPEKSEKHYPLKALYGFDNTCREAYNYDPNGYEPMLCPRDPPAPSERESSECQPEACPAGCWWMQDSCSCDCIK